MTRILVVEDEPTIAIGLQDDLAAEGYQVEVASDGDSGGGAEQHVEDESDDRRSIAALHSVVAPLAQQGGEPVLVFGEAIAQRAAGSAMSA